MINQVFQANWGLRGEWPYIEAWTNFSWQNEPWAEFSTLGVVACHAMHLLHSIAIRPNLDLKTRPKQLLGSLPLDIALPDWSKSWFTALKLILTCSDIKWRHLFFSNDYLVSTCTLFPRIHSTWTWWRGGSSLRGWKKTGCFTTGANLTKLFSLGNDIQHNDTQHNDTRHNDTQHNDTQHNNTQHNDTQHNDIQHNDIQHNDIRHNDAQHKWACLRHSA